MKGWITQLGCFSICLLACKTPLSFPPMLPFLLKTVISAARGRVVVGSTFNGFNLRILTE